MFTEIKTMKQYPSRSTEPKYHLFSKLRSGLDMCCHIRDFSFFSTLSNSLFLSHFPFIFFTCMVLAPDKHLLRNVCLFEDYRIRSDMKTNGHQLHQMQSKFDQYLQNILLNQLINQTRVPNYIKEKKQTNVNVCY